MTKNIKSNLGGSALAALLAFTTQLRADDIQVTDPLPAGTTTWSRTNTYHLNGLCHVLGGSTLRIEAGTVIKGINLGAAAIQKGGLVICRNAKIYAEGTPDKPIIFTAEIDDVTNPEDLDLYQRGLWGGVILMGNAVLNRVVDANGQIANPKFEVYEGLPDIQVGGQDVHKFGGNNDDDDSGVMRYVSIRHGGAAIEANKEINGLSLCGVGRGTTLEFIESYAIADDGFEFFGGTVNSRYLISAFNDDDAFDADQGHNGKHQFWFAIQPPDKRNFGSELNGEPAGTTTSTPQAPFSNFQLYNATIIGAGVNNLGTGGNNDALLIRDYSAPRIYNSIYTDFGRRGVSIPDVRSELMLTNGTMQIANNLWWGFTAGGVMNNTIANLAVDTRAQVLWTESARSNIIADPLLTGISRTNNGVLDPRPAAGSPAFEGYKPAPNDGFFVAANYKGAFGQQNWASDWTALGAYCVLNGNGARTPMVMPAVVCPEPVLSVVLNGSNAEITWQSQAGCSYQLKSTMSLQTPITWNNEGTAEAGTGAAIIRSVSTTGAKFFRVVAQ